MSLRYVHVAAVFFATSSLVLLAACTSSEPREDEEPDMVEVAKVLDCPIGYKPTCERRVTGRFHCYCFDRDLLRDILDPEKK